MPVRTFLDISTGNMKSTDADLLDRYADGDGDRSGGRSLIVDTTAYGWNVSLGGWSETASTEYEAAALAEGFSPEFIAILKYGVETDLDFIRFDRDAEPEPGFPLFDWDNDDEVAGAEGAAPLM